jgi:hypothetical protein
MRIQHNRTLNHDPIRLNAIMISFRCAGRTATKSLVPVPAILIAVLVLKADLHAAASSIPMIGIPAVVISVRAVIVGSYSPIAAYRAAIPVHAAIAIHIASHLAARPIRVVLAHAVHAVVIAFLRSPIAADPNILGAIALLVAGLL